METITQARNGVEVAELIKELNRRKETARDIVTPAHVARMTDTGAMIVDNIRDAAVALPMSKTAHGQTAAHLNIPLAYYNRMREAQPGLLAANVNTWMAEQKGNRMFRLLDNGIRANVSDRYRALDSYDLAFATLGVVNQVADETGQRPQVTKATLTDDRFEMRIIHPAWETDLEYPANGIDRQYGADGGHRISRPAVGKIIPGVYVSNSETGQGGLNVKPFLLDMICTNGMIGEEAFSRVHLGSRQEAGYLSAETRDTQDRLLWMQITDLIRSVFDKDRFQILIDTLKGAVAAELAAPIEAVDAVVKQYEMSEDDKQAILNELISPSHDRDPGRTVFGLLSAITERAKAYEATDPERMTTLEEAGLDFAKNARQMVAVR